MENNAFNKLSLIDMMEENKKAGLDKTYNDALNRMFRGGF